MKIQHSTLKSNGLFAIVKWPYGKAQHPNQQNGLDMYVDVLNLDTGCVCSVKLYNNTKGIHFKFKGSHYISDFNDEIVWVPYQILEVVQ